MAIIRKRGGAYLIIVSMGYDHNGKRRPPQQKTVHPPEGLTQKQTDKWLQEQATLFEMTCKNITPKRNPNTTLAEYTEIWLRDIAPTKLAKSTVIRETSGHRTLSPCPRRVQAHGTDSRPLPQALRGYAEKEK